MGVESPDFLADVKGPRRAGKSSGCAGNAWSVMRRGGRTGQAAARRSAIFSMALSARWYASSRRLSGRCCGFGRWWKRLLASGPHSCLWKNSNSKGDLNAFSSEEVGVAGAVTLEESVSLELAQIVAKLVEAVRVRGETEAGEDGLVNLACRPAASGPRRP